MDVLFVNNSIIKRFYFTIGIKLINPTWWKRRTKLERKLLILSLISLVFATALLAAAIALVVREKEEGKFTAFNESTAEPSTWQSNSDNHQNFRKGKANVVESGNVCMSPGCVKTACKILENMNTEIDPCDDFYEFACGKFERETVIPDDKTSVTTFSEISDKLKEQLRTIIETPAETNDAAPFLLAKNLYKACMNKTGIANRGHTPILDILKKLGGWPVLEGQSWNPGTFDWKETVYKFRDYGYSVDYFIDFSIGVDLKNTTIRTIDLDQPSLGLGREYLSKGFDEKIVQAYYEYQVDIATLLGADKKMAETELKESLNFEIQLANISLPNEERRNASKLFNPMSIHQLQQKFPSIPWLEYFNRLLPKHIRVNSSEVVIVSVPTFLKQLEALLSKTPKRVLANYVMWRAAGASVSYLSEDLRNRQLQYSTVLSGKESREARWKECIDIVSSGVSLAVGSMYVKKYFKEDSKKAALEMVRDIREEFNNILTNLNWMDSETKQKALEKAASMVTHIAYPDELLDVKKLEKFYDRLTVDPNYYLESVLNLTKFGTDYSFGRLRQPVNKTEWISHGRPAVVNAFYSGVENSIQFPAGILQGIFFSNDRPKYMNYGAIGFVIGHEITHGFDDQGRQFDNKGNLVDWWAKSTEEKFINRAQCIIHQYGNYTAEEVDLKLNGINTQGENIADNGGIKEAYRAYVKWSERNGEEKMLPGLPYTPRQLFWISAANTWCCKYRPEALKIRIITGVHSPGRFRVIGPLSNMPEFSKDFNCPLGSKMNPVDKCEVW
ncbi:endothelin-converting enzyme, putative [Pediculus humanus corporis]|uniref:Endothelin-converting enzyme, putative n=1 Tax=Pediculus humanus subsp. corporis TaxID=121224 RepID=E0W1I2_PEDHC|nr:endothelin-converting enzyme, putative [Pediculus humanus corporis]EEB19488.1 endothelin-converting enzyme, putative [Pediculus humanus corporis]